MTVPASGELSLGKIRQELETSDYSTGPYTANATSLSGSETGLYAVINTASPSYPNGIDPFAMSEWYSYNHAASAASFSTPVTISFTTNIVPWTNYDRMDDTIWITAYGHQYGTTSETLDLKIVDTGDNSTIASTTLTYRPGQSGNTAQRNGFNVCTIGTGSAAFGMYTNSSNDVSGFIFKDGGSLTTSTINASNYLYSPRVYYGGYHGSDHYFVGVGNGTNNNGPTAQIVRVNTALTSITELSSSPIKPFIDIFNRWNDGVFLNTSGSTLYFLYLYDRGGAQTIVRASVIEIDTSTNTVSSLLTNTSFITSVSVGANRTNPGFGVNIADNYAIVPIYMGAGNTRLHLIKWNPGSTSLTVEDTFDLSSNFGADVNLNPIDSGSFELNQSLDKLLITAPSGSVTTLATLNFTTSSITSVTNLVEIASSAYFSTKAGVTSTSSNLAFVSFGADNKPQTWSGSGYL